MHLDCCSLDLIKGWTKASVIAFVLMTAAELDVTEDWEKLRPLTHILDRCWLLPIHVPGTVVRNPFASFALTVNIKSQSEFHGKITTCGSLLE